MFLNRGDSMNISKDKLKELLKKMKTQFDFDLEAVEKAVMEAYPVKNIVTNEQLAELVAITINEHMNKKALAVAQTNSFEDPHQEAGAIAIAIGNSNKDKNISKVEIIKKAFLELMKNKDLTLLLENEGMIKNYSARTR